MPTIASHISPEGALTLMSGWTGVDFSTYDLDQQVRHVENDAGRTAMDNITRADPDRVWTVREVAQHVGIGGIGPVVVGTPEKVADAIEAWFEQTDVDGLNVPFAVSPGDFEDITRHAGAGTDAARALQDRRTAKERCGKNCSAPAARGSPHRIRPRSIGRIRDRKRRNSDSTVIARSASDEAIQIIAHRIASMDCFACARNDGDQSHRPSTITSISFAPGRLNAEAASAFKSLGSVIRIASSPSDLASPVKSTGGSAKSMPT